MNLILLYFVLDPSYTQHILYLFIVHTINCTVNVVINKASNGFFNDFPAAIDPVCISLVCDRCCIIPSCPVKLRVRRG